MGERKPIQLTPEQLEDYNTAEPSPADIHQLIQRTQQAKQKMEAYPASREETPVKSYSTGSSQPGGED